MKNLEFTSIGFLLLVLGLSLSSTEASCDLFGCNCPNGYNDGCNDCFCDDQGNVACTSKLCLVQGEPFCKPDCSTVLCLNPECESDETKITPPGECCPVCIKNPDCSVVRCAQPICGPDEIELAPGPGECCPKCFKVRDESACPKCDLYGCDSCPNGHNDGCNDCFCDDQGNVACTSKLCLVQGEPFCKPDCSAVLCLNPECESDETKITPPGECCPVCIKNPDCSVVLCARPDCRVHEIELAPTPGECCPTCFQTTYDCDTTGGATGDPHFQTWEGTYFDFQHACDLLLIKSEDFGKGLGLQINIRTKIRRDYSYIEAAAIKIGDDILEVGSFGVYFWNGVEGASPTDMIFADAYRIEHIQESKKKKRFEISLGYNSNSNKDEKLVVITYKDMVNVKVERASNGHFGRSVGMMGSFPYGTKLGRDGVTIFREEDATLFGMEWQVRDDEASLFQTTRFPQYPQACVAPGEKVTQSSRL